MRRKKPINILWKFLAYLLGNCLSISGYNFVEVTQMSFDSWFTLGTVLWVSSMQSNCRYFDFEHANCILDFYLQLPQLKYNHSGNNKKFNQNIPIHKIEIWNFFKIIVFCIRTDSAGLRVYGTIDKTVNVCHTTNATETKPKKPTNTRLNTTSYIVKWYQPRTHILAARVSSNKNGVVSCVYMYMFMIRGRCFLRSQSTRSALS